ncbi:MAG TPA: ribosome silencing factor [Aquificae bacterium]|nr:ribosome silencing factor [Aquificota bacterium]
MDTREKLKLIYSIISDKKGEDITILDLKNLSSLTDYFIIASTQSETHNRAIADEIRFKLKNSFKIFPLNVEGYETGDWILLDYGDIMVHLFKPEAREKYGLEFIWLDAPRINLEKLNETKDKVNNNK